MKNKVLITAPYLQPYIERFRPVFLDNNCEIIVPKVLERMEESDLLPIISEIDGVICGDDRFTSRVIDQASNLKVISKWGTGIDSIDLMACKKNGIKVCNTPNAFTVPVSDTVLGYILSFCRNIPFMNHAMHEGKWEKIQGRALHECTLGVVGIGNIGKCVLRKAKVFGMKLLVNDIKDIDKDLIAELEIKVTSFDNVLKNSDFISLNCDLNKSSYHLINEDSLKLVKKGAIIINTARGPIIDENSLIEALIQGNIRGAALDVFENEPLTETNPLLKMDNVLLAPHNSNSSITAWEAVHTNTIKNLLDVLEPNHMYNG